MNALTTAIERAGSAAALARICGQFPQAVTRWKREGAAPAKHCVAIERATGVRCEDLRPDLVWTRDAAGAVLGYMVPVQADEVA